MSFLEVIFSDFLCSSKQINTNPLTFQDPLYVYHRVSSPFSRARFVLIKEQTSSRHPASEVATRDSQVGNFNPKNAALATKFVSLPPSYSSTCY